MKGCIQQANSVSQRIAGYSWDGLRKDLTHIIRHPHGKPGAPERRGGEHEPVRRASE
jgi:hypothetical protein